MSQKSDLDENAPEVQTLKPGNTNGESITVPLTSSLTGLD